MSSTAVNDALTSALQSWGQGNQQAAIEGLRPHADAGEPRAILVLSWYLSQMGPAYWAEGLRYCREAVSHGMPQVAAYYFGNLINDANFRAQLPDVIKPAIAGGWPIDPLPNAPGALQQGDPATALGLIEAATVPRPYPEAWQTLLEAAQSDAAALREVSAEIASHRDTALAAIAQSQEAVDQRRQQVEQRSQSLIQLIERITNAQATSYFEEEATSYGGEAKTLWRVGLAVIVAAALAALAPVVIYYYDRARGRAPWLHGRDLTAAHVTAAVALGAVAGVLLARARGRDRARQRARDLSVALQTMFVYAEQIEDVAERQLFIREMGRTVLAAFLRQDAPAIDADRSILAALRPH
jgi:hypothetical protein